MNLRRSSVFLDFDGTISTLDTGQYLLERLGTGDWRRYDALYDAGEIGSRDCLIAQLAMLPKDALLLRDTARQIPLDEGFDDLIAFLRESEAEISIVSDGFGFHVHERCPGHTIITNDGDPATGTITFPNARPDCVCARCGTCKRAPILEAQQRGRFTVMIGDGTSDRYAAQGADLVFAKEGLERWCAANEVAFTPYTTLHDVLSVLRGVG
ncbi:MAG: 2-hydroxy-3-keto-5-methylthiopentenyl-1-phosphate phosphatase [Actinomycetota bacterium]